MPLKFGGSPEMFFHVRRYELRIRVWYTVLFMEVSGLRFQIRT